MSSRSRGPRQLHGHADARCSAGGFVVTDSLYSPSLQIGRHDHELASVCIVLAGSYDETFGRRSRRAEPGRVIIHPEGEHHANQHDPSPGRLLTIEVGRKQYDVLRREMSVLNEPWHGTDHGMTVVARRICIEARRADHDALLAIESLIMELLTKVAPLRASVSGGGAAWLFRVKDYLDAHVGTPTSLEWLSGLAGVHPVHLARVFRQAFGCSVGCYKRRLQIARAVLLLDDPTLSMSSIASDAGFADQSHMTRLLQAQTGLPPGAWRRAQERPI